MTDMLWTAGASGDMAPAMAGGGPGAGTTGETLSPGRCAAAVHRTLPRPLFLELLRRDRLRADRTDSPLALVSIRVGHRLDDAYASTVRLVDMLHAAMRESDSLGLVDEHALMVLMPDTDEEGAKRFVNRLVGAGDWPAQHPEIIAYPNALFDQLQSGEPGGLPVLPLMFADPSQSKRFQFACKRAMDIVGASVALVLLFPLMLFAAIGVKLTSPGPLIFRQLRLGRGFAPFVFLKFRSMYDKSDDKVHREQVTRLISEKSALEDGDEDGGAFYKMKGDLRVTRFGRFIRRTSIDELPQLINVLKNEMSLVGPRPPLAYETELYDPWHLRRVLEVKPGLTGLWQVEGRSEVSFDDMVRLDLRYSREWSILMDIKILFKTVWVVLRCRGAA